MAMRTGKFIVPATALIEKLTGTAGAHLPRIRGNRTGRYAGEMANLEAVEGRAYGVYQHRLDLLLGRRKEADALPIVIESAMKQGSYLVTDCFPRGYTPVATSRP
ncbi:MAG TPA: hypothetical protein VI320_40920 [Terracidiphilus sp.]|jgi:putative toxin-antitoxin system antitoxin component (TIGR02293 family)